MAEFEKEKHNKLLKFYLLIIFGWTGYLAVNRLMFILNIDRTASRWEIIFFGLLGNLIVLFSAYCFIKFRKQKLHRLTFILPTWILIYGVMIMFFAVIAAINLIRYNKEIIFGVSIDNIILSSTFLHFALIQDTLQFLLALHLMYLFYLKK